MQPVTVTISSETIKLGQFIKLASLVETGGAAKEVIADGRVQAAGTLDEIAAGYSSLEEAFFSLTGGGLGGRAGLRRPARAEGVRA